MIAHHNDVGAVATQQPQQLELRDVRILKFVDEDVAVARAESFPKRVVLAKPRDGVHDLRSKRQQLALADQEIACAIRSSDFLKLGDFHVANAAFIFGHCAANAPEIPGLLVGVPLIIVRRDEFILATRKKIHKIAEKLSRLGEPSELFELQEWQGGAPEEPVGGLVALVLG